MTRKDFELIAQTIRDLRISTNLPGQDILSRIETRNAVAQAFADSLVQTNPRFDKAKFLKACGVEQ
jgi:hypothetical protein